jgi:hypothetical protein
MPLFYAADKSNRHAPRAVSILVLTTLRAERHMECAYYLDFCRMSLTKTSTQAFWSWEFDDEFRAAAGFALDTDAPTVGFQDFAGRG